MFSASARRRLSRTINPTACFCAGETLGVNKAERVVGIRRQARQAQAGVLPDTLEPTCWATQQTPVFVHAARPLQPSARPPRSLSPTRRGPTPALPELAESPRHSAGPPAQSTAPRHSPSHDGGLDGVDAVPRPSLSRRARLTPRRR